MRVWNVGIVGGGPGGLFTAYELQRIVEFPVRVTIFEASERVGGKIMTRRFDALPARYEAGAAELYDYSPVDEDPLKALVQELGLTFQAMGGTTVIVNHQVLANLDDLRDRCGPDAVQQLLEFDRQARDAMSPRDFYEADYAATVPLDDVPPPPPAAPFHKTLDRVRSMAARRYIETLIHSDLATEPPLTSVSYGLQNYVMNHPAYMQLYSVDGGNERIPQEIARRLRADVRLGYHVHSVKRVAGGALRIGARQSGADAQTSEHDFDFDFVVVALPNSLLPGIGFQGERLAAALRRHHSQFDHPAHYLRITLLFERPFWRARLGESYFMLDAFGGCCLYDESSREPESRHGVLGWLLGGAPAAAANALPDEQLIEQALASLPEFLAHGRQYFVEGRVHRWIDSVNGMPGGSTPLSLERRHRPEPIEHPNLFLVGDYLFDSTLNGVLDSATYVAQSLAIEMSSGKQGNVS
jgi:monoamine oxidase